MTQDEQHLSERLLQDALDGTEHADKAVSVLMTAGMTILQRRFGAEKAVEFMAMALDTAGADMRRAIHGEGH